MEYNPQWATDFVTRQAWADQIIANSPRKETTMHNDFNDVHTSYLQMVFTKGEFRDKLNIAESQLRDVDFDAFAVRGTSGLVFGGALAAKMNKGLIVVRKGREQAHSSIMVEGWRAGKKYIFLDDLVCSGETRRAVAEEIKASERFEHYVRAGQYLYRSNQLLLETMLG